VGRWGWVPPLLSLGPPLMMLNRATLPARRGGVLAHRFENYRTSEGKTHAIATKRKLPG
jgi:hypothetical protein